MARSGWKILCVRYFGTDGIRGRFGESVINLDFAYSIGLALGAYLLEKGLDAPHSVVLGRDTRPSGKALLEACALGLEEKGVSCTDAGILPSPALAFAVLFTQSSLGVMITASHNPHTDNGIKLFSGKGAKFSIAEEMRIESLIKLGSPTTLAPSNLKSRNLCLPYLENLRKRFPPSFLAGTKIVLDLANGATMDTSRQAFESFGADLGLLSTGDGRINEGVGSEFPTFLAKEVIEKKAEMGIAHDGDGDRVIFVGSDGKIIDGDKILGLLAQTAREKNRLKGNAFVATVHSNSGLGEFLNQLGVDFHRASVGDRNVASMMKEVGCNWGGESSGHVIASDYLPTGDGLFIALTLALHLVECGGKLSELAKEITLWPSKSGSFRVMDKKPLEECHELQEVLGECNHKLMDQGRILLRYSGTENKVRLLVEAKEKDKADAIFEDLVKTIQKTL